MTRYVPSADAGILGVRRFGYYTAGGSTPPPAFSPLDLSPALWVDPSDASSVTLSGSSGAYIGADGLVRQGSGADYAMTNDTTALRVTGTLDLICKATLTSWATGVGQYLISKQDTATNKGYQLGVSAAGALVFTNYIATAATSTVTTGFSAGSTNWVRALVVSSTDVKFYTSPDGVAWTQLGTTVAYADTFGAATSELTIGYRKFGTAQNATGTIHKVQVWTGDSTAGGTKVFDADFEAATPFVSAFTESALGAPVYVVSSTATSSAASYGYVGPTGLVLAGSGANHASAPDIAAYDLTAEAEIVVRAVATDWTPATAATLLSHINGSTGLALTVHTDGTLKLVTDAATSTSTVATGFTDGTAYWIKATYKDSTNEVKFWWAADASTEPGSWTQLGTTVTQASALTASTSALFVGALSSGSQVHAGTIMRAILRSTIDGTTVFDANFATAADYAASFVESSSNAATVTITATNTPANAAGACVSQINDKSGNSRHLTQGTLANMPKYWNGRNGNNCLVFDGTNDLMKTASAVTNSAPFASLSVVQLGASPGANIYVWDSHTTVADVVMSTLTTTSVRVFAGTNLSAVQAVVGRRDIWAAKLDGASSTLRVNGAEVAAGNAGANVHELLTLGSMANGTANWWKGTIGEVIFWPSPSSFTAVESYASTKWGTP